MQALALCTERVPLGKIFEHTGLYENAINTIKENPKKGAIILMTI
jgi:hypothetical protein